MRRIQSRSERFDTADVFVRKCAMCLSWQWLLLFLAGVQHWEEFLQCEIKSYPCFGRICSCKVSGFQMCRTKHAPLLYCTAYIQLNARHGKTLHRIVITWTIHHIPKRMRQALFTDRWQTGLTFSLQYRTFLSGGLLRLRSLNFRYGNVRIR